MCTGIKGIQFAGTVVPRTYLISGLITSSAGGSVPESETGGFSKAISSPLVPLPDCEGTILSTPQTILAISSRTKFTCSSGWPSKALEPGTR